MQFWTPPCSAGHILPLANLISFHSCAPANTRLASLRADLINGMFLDIIEDVKYGILPESFDLYEEMLDIMFTTTNTRNCRQTSVFQELLGLLTTIVERDEIHLRGQQMFCFSLFFSLDFFSCLSVLLSYSSFSYPGCNCPIDIAYENEYIDC